MTTQAADQQQANNIVPNTHTATLVRGESYFLGNTRFAPKVSVPVPKYIKEHLERTAVDHVDVEGHAEAKQKFEFKPIANAGLDKAEVEDPTEVRNAPRAARQRGRAVAGEKSE